MIGVLDHGSGNISAITNALSSQNIAYAVVQSEEVLEACDRFILPGVGTYDDVMEGLSTQRWYTRLLDLVSNFDYPLLGICVGMQVLGSLSEEGRAEGMGLIPGSVRLLDLDRTLPLPHMGWNSVCVESDSQGLFHRVEPSSGFYFLHSYYFKIENDASLVATTNYGGDFPCSVSNGKNVFGVQFHPEKSHDNGLRLLLNFSRL